MSSSLDFKEILESLGVKKMFKREEAYLGKLFESEGFHVSKVRENVFIEVIEEGTEAAATDVHGLSPVSAPTTIKMDRPFIFQICDSVTGTILRIGRVPNPNDSRNKPRSLVSDSEDVSWNWNICIALFSAFFIKIIAVGIMLFVRAKGCALLTN